MNEGGNDGGRDRSQFLKIEASELADRLDVRCGGKWGSQGFGVHDIYSGRSLHLYTYECVIRIQCRTL